MEEKILENYALVESLAENKQMESLLRALPFIKEQMSNRGKTEAARNRYMNELQHALDVCLMLINLHLPLDREEEDILLTAAALHIYPENFDGGDAEEKLVTELGFDRRVLEIIEITMPGRDLVEEEQQLYYDRIQQNRLALLLALADRGNIVQQLHRFTTWNAHRYIDETKACYFPMCIYGKEHYHDLLAPISVLMEKIRNLLEVAEILLRRYEVREAELMQDILALREENATIKGIIAKFQAQQ